MTDEELAIQELNKIKQAIEKHKNTQYCLQCFSKKDAKLYIDTIIDKMSEDEIEKCKKQLRLK